MEEINNLELKSIILAFAETTLSKEQWEEFNTLKAQWAVRLASKIVKDNPHLLDESPELKKYLL